MHKRVFQPDLVNVGTLNLHFDGNSLYSLFAKMQILNASNVRNACSEASPSDLLYSSLGH